MLCVCVLACVLAYLSVCLSVFPTFKLLKVFTKIWGKFAVTVATLETTSVSYCWIPCQPNNSTCKDRPVLWVENGSTTWFRAVVAGVTFWRSFKNTKFMRRNCLPASSSMTMNNELMIQMFTGVTPCWFVSSYGGFERT